MIFFIAVMKPAELDKFEKLLINYERKMVKKSDVNASAKKLRQIVELPDLTSTNSAPDITSTNSAPDIIRTKKNGCYQLKKANHLGQYYSQVEDPLASSDDEIVKSFILSEENFGKINEGLIACIYKLFSHLAQKSYGTEVQVLLIRKYDDPFLWRALVPKQVVGPASVHADCRTYADIETGELVENGVFPPEGWFHAGSSHSHVNMNAFFSSTDDESELKTPGVHFVWGKLKEAQIAIIASVVCRRTRYIVPIGSIAHLNLNHEATFHDNVLPLIKNQPVAVSKGFPLGKLSKVPTRNFDFSKKPANLSQVKKARSRSDFNKYADDYNSVSDDPLFFEDPFFFDPNFSGYEKFQTEEVEHELTPQELLNDLEEILVNIHWMKNLKLLEDSKQIVKEYL